jgi:hypothetical protein
MAKKSASFLDLHIEKVVVGLCGAAMLGAVVLSFGGGRFAVDGRGCGEMCQAIGSAADQTRQALQGARPQETARGGPAGPDPAAQLKDWFGEGARGLIAVARIEPDPGRTQPVPPPLASNADALTAEKRNLAKVVAPGLPMVMGGRSVFSIVEPKPELAEFTRSAEAEFRQVASPWVSVGAQVDLVAQDANFTAERYPERAHPIVVQVHLQRKDMSEKDAGWEDVDTYLPFRPFKRPQVEVTPDGKIRLERLDTFTLKLEASSEEIARPKLPARVSGDKTEILPIPYLEEPPAGAGGEADLSRRVTKWLSLAKAAMNGRRPFREVDVDAAFLLARSAAGTEGAREKDVGAARQLLEELTARLRKTRPGLDLSAPRAADRLMPLVAHDFSPEPGRTYTYRMRYEILNIYAGNARELNHPRDAEALTVFSDWSPATRPILVQSDTYFYLTKADRAKKEAVVTVIRDLKARGVSRKDYKLQVGERIGREEKTGQKVDFRTGAICLEIDFDRLVDGKSDVALVYVDTNDGGVRERFLSRDNQDPYLKALLAKKPARG